MAQGFRFCGSNTAAHLVFAKLRFGGKILKKNASPALVLPALPKQLSGMALMHVQIKSAISTINYKCGNHRCFISLRYFLSRKAEE